MHFYHLLKRYGRNPLLSLQLVEALLLVPPNNTIFYDILSHPSHITLPASSPAFSGTEIPVTGSIKVVKVGRDTVGAAATESLDSATSPLPRSFAIRRPKDGTLQSVKVN